MDVSRDALLKSPHGDSSGENQREKYRCLDCDDESSHSQKSKDWMNSCRYGSESPVSDKIVETICIRYDFDKSVQTPSTPKSLFTQATPLVSYMEKTKNEFHLNNNCKATSMNGNAFKINGNFDNTLSPDSQKRELCSYLQLMNPADKRECFVALNRRSLRARKIEYKSKEGENIPITPHAEIGMNVINKLMPLPIRRIYSEQIDFDESIKDLICEANIRHKKRLLKKPKKFKFELKSRFNLRSRKRLRNISLDRLILRQSHSRKKARRRFLRAFKNKVTVETPRKIESPRCEIISIHGNSDDENIDLKNFVDDMLELDKMSEEHRKCVIETRILASSSITNLINKRSNQEENVQKAFKIFSDLSNEHKTSEEKENALKDEVSEPEHESGEKETHYQDELKICENAELEAVKNLVIREHDYASLRDKDDDDEEEEEEEEEDQDEDDEVESCVSLSPVPIPHLEVLPVNTLIEIKSLHRSLRVNPRRMRFLNNYGLHNWGPKSENNNMKHSITVNKKNGKVLKAFYQDYNLVIVQQTSVSFWTQSALGEVLGAQNMWIPKGDAQRIPLNSTYSQKDTRDMVISTETSLVYVELWTKEHKSEMREVPVADVFATVYFWRLRQNGLDKKALQLENIKGIADDVQYCVLKFYPKIIVSWHSGQGTERKTKIHSYHLATDFQTVANISEIQPVKHYVTSLHNIEDCDNLIMGCGENKVTLWNIEYGYIVATIELDNIKLPISTHWVKCDRGFLFTVQECVDQELRLIAINGMNHSWKKLQSYTPSTEFEGLKGVCMDNGVLLAYYRQGILCWNAQTGELIVEEVPNQCEYIPSGKNVIILANEKIIVKYSLSHLITTEEL